MSDTLFQKAIKTAGISAEQQVIEQLAKYCQKLDFYLNTTPGNERCFITRGEIGEAREYSPLFEMARFLGDPVLIKHNVNKITKPLLQCLRSFIDGSINKVLASPFAEKLLELAEIANNAYWLLVKQASPDTELLKVVSLMREQLFSECVKLDLQPKQQDCLAEVKAGLFSRVISVAFQGSLEKQHQRENIFRSKCEQFSQSLESQFQQQRTLPTVKIG